MDRMRSATLSDYSAINKLSVLLGYGIDSTQETLQAVIDSSNDQLWVLERDNQLVAWIQYCKVLRAASSAFIEIVGLVVDPSYRRQGIGQQLVRHAMLWASEQNLSVRVRSNIKRADAHAFYESLGFQIKKSQHVFEL